MKNKVFLSVVLLFMGSLAPEAYAMGEEDNGPASAGHSGEGQLTRGTCACGHIFG